MGPQWATASSAIIITAAVAAAAAASGSQQLYGARGSTAAQLSAARRRRRPHAPLAPLGWGSKEAGRSSRQPAAAAGGARRIG
jgi:hypothetical protein